MVVDYLLKITTQEIIGMFDTFKRYFCRKYMLMVKVLEFILILQMVILTLMLILITFSSISKFWICVLGLRIYGNVWANVELKDVILLVIKLRLMVLRLGSWAELMLINMDHCLIANNQANLNGGTA